MNRICPKCNKSREIYYVVERDPKDKKKFWRIERCQSCGWNFEIEEATGNEIRTIKRPKDPIIRPRPPEGGWLV